MLPDQRNSRFSPGNPKFLFSLPKNPLLAFSLSPLARQRLWDAIRNKKFRYHVRLLFLILTSSYFPFFRFLSRSTASRKKKYVFNLLHFVSQACPAYGSPRRAQTCRQSRGPCRSRSSRPSAGVGPWPRRWSTPRGRVNFVKLWQMG